MQRQNAPNRAKLLAVSGALGVHIHQHRLIHVAAQNSLKLEKARELVAMFCKNISCKTSRTQSQNVSGTKTCPQPLPCQTVCDTACSAWSSWSAGTPAADTECKGDTFTQTSTKTRTCPGICNDSA